MKQISQATQITAMKAMVTFAFEAAERMVKWPDSILGEAGRKELAEVCEAYTELGYDGVGLRNRSLEYAREKLARGGL